MWSELRRPPLRAEAIEAVIAPGGLWQDIRVVPETGSTNADLAALVRSGGAREGTVVATDHQVTGRGRLDRSWTAPPRSSLAVSALLTPRDVPQSRWSWLPLLTGVAMVDVLTRVAGLPARLKWPNDVLVEDRKVCGILVELVAGPGGAYAVVGCGLNVSQDEEELPVPSATSLLLAGAATTDRTVLLRAYLRALELRYGRWRAAGGDPRTSDIGAAYREACSTIGRGVRVHRPDGTTLAGLADGVDDEGRLLVLPEARPAGPVLALAAGDVVHVRTA